MLKAKSFGFVDLKLVHDAYDSHGNLNDSTVGDRVGSSKWNCGGKINLTCANSPSSPDQEMVESSDFPRASHCLFW